jgi:hypothetical protein
MPAIGMRTQRKSVLVLQYEQVESMSTESYTYYSRKYQGYRRNITVGPKDVYQMTGIKDLKSTDLDKIENFVRRNGCNVLIERIEKDCNGVGCITIWTNRYAFHEWQAENDIIYNCVMNSLPLPVFNETHTHTNILFDTSSLPINANVDNGDFHAFTVDAYDGEMRPILYSCSQQDLGQRMLRNQGDLGIFGFLIYVYHTMHPTEQQIFETNPEIEEFTQNIKRHRKPFYRMTYERLGEPTLHRL